MLLQIVLYCLLPVVKGYRAKKKTEFYPYESVLEKVTGINKTKICWWYLGSTARLTSQTNVATNIEKLDQFRVETSKIQSRKPIYILRHTTY